MRSGIERDVEDRVHAAGDQARQIEARAGPSAGAVDRAGAGRRGPLAPGQVEVHAGHGEEVGIGQGAARVRRDEVAESVDNVDVLEDGRDAVGLVGRAAEAERAAAERIKNNA